MTLEPMNNLAKTKLVTPLLADQPTGVEPITASQLWAITRRRWWLALCVTLLVFAAGQIYIRNQNPIYESTAQLLIPTAGSIPVTNDDLGMMSDLLTLAREKTAEGQADILSSPDMLYSAVQKMNEDELQRGFKGISSVIDYKVLPEWAITVTANKSSDIIAVTAKAYDPKVAANLANTVALTYLERDRGLLGQTVQYGRQFVESELSSVQSRLQSARMELAQYKGKTGLLVPEAQLPSFVSKAAALQAELEKSNIDLAASRQRADALHKLLTDQGIEVRETTIVQRNPEYQAVLSRLNDLNSQRVLVSQEYSLESKQVRNLDAAILDATQHLKRITETVVESTTKIRNPLLSNYWDMTVSNEAAAVRVSALQRMVSVREKRMQSFPSEEAHLAQLTQKAGLLEGTFKTMSEKYYALLSNEKSTLPNALFASTARVPLAPSYPNTRKTTMAFLLIGIALGVVSSVAAEQLDRRVREPEMVTRLLGVRPLSLVPNRKRNGISHLQTGAAVGGNSFAESFRILRHSIWSPKEIRPLKMLAITSPGRCEGKATTAVNLAIAAAMSGKKVLIVDCDFRKPSLYNRTSASRDTGLSSLVKGLATLGEAVLPTGHERVFCLPSGPEPTNPAEFLMGQDCRDTFKMLANEYDVVLLDSPPCAGLSDMQVISSIVEGILLVVSLGRTSKSGLINTVKILEGVDAPVLGLVINRANLKRDGYDYHVEQSRYRKRETRMRNVAIAESQESDAT